MVTKLQHQINVSGDDQKEHLGLVHVYTGSGKGKTTASLGLAFRAIGNGLKVYMIQFLKSGDTGELFSVLKYLPNMTIIQCGLEAVRSEHHRAYSLDTSAPEEPHSSEFHFLPDACEKDASRQGFELAKKVISSKEYDLVILDEINCVMDKGLIPINEVLEMLREDHKGVEIVLTGRDAPAEILEIADYVSVIERAKHPWMKGIRARKGVEY